MEDIEYTPVQRCGKFLLKRDDLYVRGGANGGKGRACFAIAEATPNAVGLIGVAARISPQLQRVARVAHTLGLACRLHTATGPDTPTMADARAHGAAIIQHKPGYNSVIIARADEDAKIQKGWAYIPFGAECQTAINATRDQVTSLYKYKDEIKRIVVCCGSGVTCAGILWGLHNLNWDVPILGVRIGMDPRLAITKWGPWGGSRQVHIATSRYSYTTELNEKLLPATGPPIELDPNYESKCVEYLQPGDLFWIVGKRIT